MRFVLTSLVIATVMMACAEVPATTTIDEPRPSALDRRTTPGETDTGEMNTGEADEDDGAEARPRDRRERPRPITGPNREHPRANGLPEARTSRLAIDRGIWMYYHPGNPLGLGEIIGNPSAEANAINHLQNWGVRRVYGSFQDLPVTNRGDVASWNQDLHAQGMESQLLLGAPHYIFPGADCRGRLIEQLQERLVDFHEGVAVVGGGPVAVLLGQSRFRAVHLDVEPHQFKASYYAGTSGPPSCAPTADYWNLPTTSRAELFALLADTIAEVRTFMDANGQANVDLHIDLPAWVDTSSSFDWNDTPDYTNGIDWIADVGGMVDGITFMTYERDNAADIRDWVLGERFVLLDSIDVRVAVNARERSPISSIITWTSPSQFWSVVSNLQSGTGLYAYGVDLHNYRYLRMPWLLGPLHHFSER